MERNVEAITVYQDGKVGINNTTPSSVLDVGGNTSITGDLTITDTDTGSSAILNYHWFVIVQVLLMQTILDKSDF